MFSARLNPTFAQNSPMISKAQISFVNSLKLKKHRQSGKLFVAEGEKIVNELLASPMQIAYIMASRAWIESHPGLANQHLSKIVETPEAAMAKISSLSTPSPVLAVVHMPGLVKPVYNAQDLYLALDEIQDPGNLGTIIRICDWFGITNLICSIGCADLFNPKTIQASMGAFLRVHVFYSQLDDEIENYRSVTGHAVYGTFLEGDNIYETELPSGGFVVMGNEGKGINPQIAQGITHKLYIPSFSLSPVHAESLNVSVATAITCSEFMRRRCL